MKKGLILLFWTVFGLPFVYLALLSAAGQWRYPRLWPEGLDFTAWRYVFSGDSSVGQSVLLSLLLSLSVAFLATISGFFISKSLAARREKQGLLTVAYFPYAFSPVVYAFCLNYLFIRLNLTGTTAGVVLAQYIITFPFAVILCSRHWSPELISLENVALTLGAAKRQAFLKVVLPLSKNMLLICFFQTFVISWFEYGLTSVIGLGKVQTLTVKTYQYIGESNLNFAALASTLLVFPPLLLLWFNQRFVFTKI